MAEACLLSCDLVHNSIYSLHAAPFRKPYHADIKNSETKNEINSKSW